MSTENPTTRRTDTRRTRPSNARIERDERESEAPLCPDLMRAESPTTRRTDTRRTRPSDARTERDERESEAPLCPDISTSWVSSQDRIRRELGLIRRQLDRIERRMDAEMEAQ